VDSGITSEDMMRPGCSVAQSQDNARRAFQGSFQEGCSRGLSPNSAALEALRQHREAAKPAQGQADARRQLRSAFLQQCERGLSPTSAAVELLHLCGAAARKRPAGATGAAAGTAGSGPSQAEEAAGVARAAPGIPAGSEKLSESKELLVRETGSSNPLPA